MTTRRLLTPVLLLCAGACAQESHPLTSVALFKVAPENVAAFVARAKAFVPTLDKLVASGVVSRYGVSTDVLHVPGENNVAFWVEVADYAGLDASGDAIDAFEAANPAVMKDLRAMSDPATHHDLIVRSLECRHKAVPAGKTPMEDFDVIQVKPGRMDEFTGLFRKYEKPVLDKLVDDGVIYGYQLDVEAVHTMKPGMVWQLMQIPNLEAKGKVRAAFQEAMKKAPEAEATMVQKMYDDVTVEGSHRDSLSLAVIYREK